MRSLLTLRGIYSLAKRCLTAGRTALAKRTRRHAATLRLEELEARTTPTVSVVPQQFSTSQYTALTITQDQLLAGDTGDGALSLRNPTQPAQATLADNHNGTFTFTPDAGLTGSTAFQYTVGTQQATLAIPNMASFYGNLAVAVSGNTAIIGVPNGYSNSGPVAGAAYVFVKTSGTWNQQAVLAASSPSIYYDNFGSAVAIDGDTALVGDSGQGTTYVFSRANGSWSQQATLTPNNGSPGYGYYNSVALSGDTAVLSDSYHDAADVFVRANGVWTQQAALTDPASTSYTFANIVSVDGNTVLVGDDYRGAADVFVRTGSNWTLQTTLTIPQPDPSTYAYYYYFNNLSGVSISADTAVLSDSYNRVAEVFTRSGGIWTPQAALTPPTGGNYYGDFGSSVSVSGDTAVVSDAYGGAAYVYTRNGGSWTPQLTLTPNGGSAGTNYLGSAAVSGSLVIFSNGSYGSAPAAYVQDLDSATATATVQVSPATAQLFVSPGNLPTGAPDGVYDSPTIKATGGAGVNYTFRESGVLPAGLTFDPATARFVGTPTQAGIFPGIVIAASDGQGGSGSQTYTLTIDHSTYIRSLYHDVLNRLPDSSELAYWEYVFSVVKDAPQQFGMAAGTDPYFYVAQGVWASQEHRTMEVESYYHNLLGRDLNLSLPWDAGGLSYWTGQFFYNGANEESVQRGFLSSAEYLFKHRNGSLMTALNTDVLGNTATAADLQTWTTKLDKATSFDDYDNEHSQTGLLFDLLGSNEYAQGKLDSYYLTFVHRAGSAAEKQALLDARDPYGNAFALGTIAEMMLSSQEYRKLAANSGAK